MRPPPAASPTEQDDRTFGLDALRAAAILAVVSAHGFGTLYPHVPGLGLLGHGGFYGVELFFVLSGFLIGRILIRLGPELGDSTPLATFYLRRWFRTLPLFWLFLAVNVALEWHLHNHRPGPAAIVGHGLFLRNLAGHHLTFFAESWSLAVEEWFYLLFPAALWLGLRITRRFDRVFLLVTAAFYAFSTVGRMLSADQPPATWHTWQRTIVLLRFDALMIGVGAAWLALRFPAWWSRVARPAALAGGILLALMYASLWSVQQGQFVAGGDTFFARTFRFNLVSLGFALLLPAASGWHAARTSPGPAAIRGIALWSYSIYLVHLPVIDFVGHYCFKRWQTDRAEAFALFGLQIGLTLLVGAAIHHAVEAPCTRLREKAAPWLTRRWGAARP